MKLKPLQEWYCDYCGEVIESPQQGWLEWLMDDDHKRHGFKIVHHALHSPKHPHGSCYHYDDALDRQDMHLNDHVGDRGLVVALSWLDVGSLIEEDYSGPWIRDIREWVELARRLFVPYYEEARRYLPIAQNDGFFDGANEIFCYIPSTLERIIKEYEDAE